MIVKRGDDLAMTTNVTASLSKNVPKRDRCMTPTPTLSNTVERMLACPCCHGSVSADTTEIRCTSAVCEFRGAISGEVVIMSSAPVESFFDERFERMRHEGQGECVMEMCCGTQAPRILPHLVSGSVVLDVGCGFQFPFERDPACFLIGLDASLATVRAHETLDLRVYGTSTAIPLPDASVDTIILSYSLHHMTGLSVRANYRIAVDVLRELNRVLKPGGVIFILEIHPWLPVWLAEKQLWTLARRVLGSKLDMFFWFDQELAGLIRSTLPRVRLEVTHAPTRWFSVLAPIFSIRWLQVPRFMYPFSVVMYQLSKYA
jgi:ubiquinone/menaquinone biosynthesis C-methylase UbiE